MIILDRLFRKSHIIASEPRGSGQWRVIDTVTRGQRAARSFEGRTPDIWRIVRQSIPFIDSGINQLVGMIQGFRVEADDRRAQKYIDNYLKTVPVNYVGRGIDDYLWILLDSALMFGRGIGEIDDENLYLYTGQVDRLKIETDNGIRLLYAQNSGGYKELDPLRAHLCVLLSREDNIFGVSILDSIPTAAETYNRIREAVHNTVWRAGDPTWVVSLTASDDADEREREETMQQVVSQLRDISLARLAGRVKDMAVSLPYGYTIKIAALGSDGRAVAQVDFEVVTKVLLQEILSALMLPPYRFALEGWNANYRMSTDQALALKTQIVKFRDRAEPVIDKIIRYVMASRGIISDYRIIWDELDFQDLKDRAEIGKVQAEMKKIQAETLLMFWERGLIDDEELYRESGELGLIGENIKFADFSTMIRRAHARNIAKRLMGI